MPVRGAVLLVRRWFVEATDGNGNDGVFVFVFEAVDRVRGVRPAFGRTLTVKLEFVDSKFSERGFGFGLVAGFGIARGIDEFRVFGGEI